MPRRHWRRFLPPYRRSLPRRGDASLPLFSRVRDILNSVQVRQFKELESIIEQRKTLGLQDSVSLLTLLILQSPRAASAQESMDRHPHGYHDREKRLYELIDFNDTFVSTVLSLPETELVSFVDSLKSEVDLFCRRLNTKPFTDKQFEAIIHGLSREIAVYRAALSSGFEVMMTSRIIDAFGVDMQVGRRETGAYINIDCKTTSAFHFRLKDLVRQGRISSGDQANAEEKGYWEIINRGEDREMRIVLLRVNQEELGEIEAFTFVDSRALIGRLTHIISERGLTDGQFNRISRG